MIIKHYPTFPDRPNNPASCNRRTRTIYINDAIWHRLTPIQQQYWLNHEIGHITLQTPDERQADHYALSRVALTAPYSLTQIRQTMLNTVKNQPERLRASAIDSLQYSAAAGSAVAQQMLLASGNTATKAPVKIINKTTPATIRLIPQNTATITTKPAITTKPNTNNTTLTQNKNANLIDTTADPASNTIISEPQPDDFYIDAPCIDTLQADETRTTDDQIFLTEPQTTVATTTSNSSPVPRPDNKEIREKGTLVEVELGSVKIANTDEYDAAATVAQTKAKEKSLTTRIIILAIIALIIIIALITYSYKK